MPDKLVIMFIHARARTMILFLAESDGRNGKD
jgi:hypothetical protein